MKNTNNNTGYRHEIVFLHQQGDFQVLFTENLAFLAFVKKKSRKLDKENCPVWTKEEVTDLKN